MNSLINIAVLLTGLPALASSETINTIRFTTQSLSALTAVFSTISLLLVPKVRKEEYMLRPVTYII